MVPSSLPRQADHGPAPLPETAPMALLSGLFLLRVIGQLLVARRRVRWLPPMAQWQSGLLPYPALVAAQGAILALQTTIEIQAFRGHGGLVWPRRRFSRVLRWLSRVYGAAMVFRYGLTMRRYPERRWFGQTIPIVFHCVLATYLFLYSRILGRSGDDPRAPV